YITFFHSIIHQTPSSTLFPYTTLFRSKMKIEVWSDFACPASYVGRELLKTAINCFGKDKHIEIEYRSYQIDPAQSIPKQLIAVLDRKSTRLNSSHVSISYAVFCLKKKN